MNLKQSQQYFCMPAPTGVNHAFRIMFTDVTLSNTNFTSKVRTVLIIYASVRGSEMHFIVLWVKAKTLYFFSKL